MTREEMIRLTGLKQVGAGDTATACGLMFGFPVKAVPGKKDLTLYFYMETEPDNKTVKAINKRLWDGTELKGKFGTANATQNQNKETGNYLAATFHFKGEEPQPFYSQALSALEAALREEGVTAPSKTCPICGLSEGDALAMYEGQLSVVHMSCLRRWSSERQEQLELKAQNSGPLRGILGGLIGGVVGAVPAFLALFFFEYFVGILFVPIPLGIYYGWKLFGGRLSRLTTVFTVAYSLVVGLAVEILDSFLILRAIFPTLNITLGQTIEAYLDPELFTELFMRSTLIAVGFTALGIFFAWRLITRTDKHEAADAQTIVDEAVSLEQAADR